MITTACNIPRLANIHNQCLDPLKRMVFMTVPLTPIIVLKVTPLTGDISLQRSRRGTQKLAAHNVVPNFAGHGGADLCPQLSALWFVSSLVSSSSLPTV